MPLANELGVDTRVEQTQIRLCWKRGWFDYKVPNRKQRETPALESTATRVQHIYHAYRNTQDKVAALHQQGLCRDAGTAQQVVKQLDLVQELAAEAVWGLTITTAMYGPVGMLKHSDYPSTLINELLWLEQQAATITRMSEHPATVLAELRADIIALHHTLHSMDEAHGQQEEVKKQQRIERAKAGNRKKKRQQKQEPDPLAPTQQPTLWRPDMLSQPRYSKERKQYQEHVAQRRTEIIASLSQHRGCDEMLATLLLDALLSAGWDDIINWRCTIPQQERYHRGFLMERMRASLNVHLGFLKSIYRQDIEQFLIDMQQVIDQLGISLSLFPLVDEHPGTPYRHQCRRLLQKDKRIVKAYAACAGQEDEEASARLFAFAGYGGMGALRFFKQEELDTIIEPALSRFIHFHKVAHLDDGFDVARLTDPVNAFAASFNLSALSPQVVRAIFNRSRKPNRWNVGQGEASVHLLSSPSNSLPKAPQLLRAWVIAVVPLRINVVDAERVTQSNTCYVSLVLDQDSELAMGCWPSIDRPGPREFALALYQSIWHVGWIEWPVNGTPDTVKIPASSVSHEEQMADLRRAGQFLIADIKTYEEEKYWPNRPLAKELREDGADAIYTYTHYPHATPRHIQDALLGWLNETCFQSHNPASPDALVTYHRKGFAMPGYDSPAAGWLLPRADKQVKSIRDGVVKGTVIYRAQHFQIDPGHVLFYREFPFAYPGTERGIFVEHDGFVRYLESRREYPLD
jgi:hypothetical protein